MHHFSHYQAAECEKGIETALHLLGKQIIEKTKRLLCQRYPPSKNPSGKLRNTMRRSKKKKIDGSIKPDVQLRARMDLWGAGLVVNVEIKVSHAVDEAKKFKLLELGFPTVEIDLSDVESDYTEETIRKTNSKR